MRAALTVQGYDLSNTREPMHGSPCPTITAAAPALEKERAPNELGSEQRATAHRPSQLPACTQLTQRSNAEVLLAELSQWSVPSTSAQPSASANAISSVFKLLLRSSNDAPTCSMPISTGCTMHRRINRCSAVSAIEAASSYSLQTASWSKSSPDVTECE